MMWLRALISVALLGTALPVYAQAQDATCIAVEQCRGDAKRMCAPSSLRIDVVRDGTGAVLKIDRQGPYRASLQRNGDVQLVTLQNFGGAYKLLLKEDGSFTYLGNRGKRFNGHCEGTL